VSVLVSVWTGECCILVHDRAKTEILRIASIDAGFAHSRKVMRDGA